MRRIPSLDGFRAISILLVVISHFRFSAGFPVKYADLVRHGAVGVTVFFVISGFLITYLLLNEESKTGNISLKRFYFNRSLRILPVFTVYTIFVLVWNHFNDIGLSHDNVVHALTFTVNFDQKKNWFLGHFWSLSVEEQFYIFWPTMLILFRRHIKVIFVVLILYSCLTRVIAYKFPAYTVICLSPFFNYSDSIFIGALGAMVFFKNPAICKLRIFGSYPLQLAALLLIAAFVYCSGYGKLGVIALPFGNVIISAAILFLLFSYLTPTNAVVFKLLNSRFFVHIGVLSYSIYIWQEFFFVGRLASGWLAFPRNIPVIYLVALGSYYLCEKPFLRLKKQLVNKEPQPAIQ